MWEDFYGNESCCDDDISSNLVYNLLKIMVWLQCYEKRFTNVTWTL